MNALCRKNHTVQIGRHNTYINTLTWPQLAIHLETSTRLHCVSWIPDTDVAHRFWRRLDDDFVKSAQLIQWRQDKVS